jgi:hypothetical protein
MAYMAAMTLTNLLALVRVYLHEYDTSHGTFWLDAGLTLHINSAYRYYMLLIERYNPGAFAEAFAPITVSKTITTHIDLPPEFLIPWALWWQQELTVRPTLIWKSPRFVGVEGQKSATPYFDDEDMTDVPSVRVLGSKVLLIPTPPVNGVIIPEGIVFPIDLVGSAAVDARIHPVAHSLIAQRAAFFALAEDGESIQNYSGLVTSLAVGEQNLIAILSGASFEPLNTESKQVSASTQQPQQQR